MKRVGAVFAQPSMDQNNRPLLSLWYAKGVRLFIGWASTQNTSGRDPIKDRAAQLAWRKAVAGLGPDAQYIDYPLPAWNLTPTPEDIALMVNDPACAGFYGPDEPNLTPPVGGNVWRIATATWYKFWEPILAGDPGDTKLRCMQLTGSKLTGSWADGYHAADVVPYMVDPGTHRKIVTLALQDWYPKNANYLRYGNDLPAKGLRALGWVGDATVSRGLTLECSNQELAKTSGVDAAGKPIIVSGNPTPADMWEQYQTALKEIVVKDGVESHPFTVVCYFPQAPKPSAAHKFTNCSDAQWDMCAKVLADFAPVAVPAPWTPPANDDEALKEDVDGLLKDVTQLQLDLAAARTTIATLTEQSKLNNDRLNSLETWMTKVRS